MPKVSKSKNQKRRSRSSETSVTCTALLVVDQAPFVKKALSTWLLAESLFT
ncbi:Unannotated [Lentimonas sp. CC4]|nr:Unannotated [Lentimonas sp. CC4]CAA6687435.1 Unannotated [Lentimonas sp. CC6]CAA7075176.1 Unannotated [Lentimonas sp. CC4]CAA7172084.1 Unannotated [Lentimonas sp. CC21]CAA7180021.1 Unannotated [Lentimonas sp. CC8]